MVSWPFPGKPPRCQNLQVFSSVRFRFSRKALLLGRHASILVRDGVGSSLRTYFSLLRKNLLSHGSALVMPDICIINLGSILFIKRLNLNLIVSLEITFIYKKYKLDDPINKQIKI